jgi:hypothetical protein
MTSAAERHGARGHALTNAVPRLDLLDRLDTDTLTGQNRLWPDKDCLVVEGTLAPT